MTKIKPTASSYKKAGVDIEAGYQAVELMKKHIARTKNDCVVSDIGGFGGLFELDLKAIKNPILVSGTDGVGTKLKLAFLLDKHDSVGIDCVAMCVNDVICCGAKPLFFLDYIACGKQVPEKIESIVSGICMALVESGAALIGGETAEMPGFYPEDEYDLAGFCTAIVDKEKIIDGSQIKAGDVMIAIASSGVHSNGFSLIRKLFGIDEGKIDKDFAEQLLTPTKIYVKPILDLIEKLEVKAISHITGGGFYENIPRSLKTGYGVKIKKDDIAILPIFKKIQERGKISDEEMFNTFNMGVGMTVIVAKENLDKAITIIKAHAENAYYLGEVIESEEKIILC